MRLTSRTRSDYGAMVASLLLAGVVGLAGIACTPPKQEVSLVAEPAATVATADVAATVTAVCGADSAPVARAPFDTPPPTPRPTNTLLRDAMPALAALPTASQVVIERGSTGYSPVPKALATYTLARAGDVFKGDAHFLVKTRGGTQHEQTLAVAVPTVLMEGVLGDLRAIRVSPGPYKPWIEWTDDYPDLSMRVTFGNQEARFFSKSQGPGSVPWGVQHGGQTVVAESKDIAVAFGRLEPCLLRGPFREMVRSAVVEELQRGR